MFSNLVKGFFSKIIIGINIDSKLCYISVHHIKGNKLKRKIKTEVKVVDDDIPMEIIKLVKFYKKKYPFTYVGLITKTYNQGALPCINQDDFIKYGVNTSGLNILNIDQQWSVYIKQANIKEILAQCEVIYGVDFLISPILLVYNKIKDNLSQNPLLYVLQEKSAVTILIIKDGKVEFGNYFAIELSAGRVNQASIESQIDQNNSTLDELMSSLDNELNESIDLDNLHFDPDDDILGELDEEEDTNSEEELLKIEELKDLSRAANTVSVLEDVIKEYYTNELYESAFLEKIVIMDTYGMLPDAVKHIKESMLMDIQTINISITDEIVSMIKSSLGDK